MITQNLLYFYAAGEKYRDACEALEAEYVEIVTEHLKENDKELAIKIVDSMPPAISKSKVNILIDLYINKTSKSYKDGYETGAKWKDSYRPGGPFACDKESYEQRKEWMQGFNEAIKIRNIVLNGY